MDPQTLIEQAGLDIKRIEDFVRAPLAKAVSKSRATGEELLSNGHLGVDMIYLPPNESFPLHVHPGDHLLLVVEGQGSVTLERELGEREVQITKPGDIYMVNADVPHAVGAGPAGHWLLSFGAPHRRIDSPDRMEVMDREVVAQLVRDRYTGSRDRDLAIFLGEQERAWAEEAWREQRDHLERLHGSGVI